MPAQNLVFCVRFWTYYNSYSADIRAEAFDSLVISHSANISALQLYWKTRCDLGLVSFGAAVFVNIFLVF